MTIKWQAESLIGIGNPVPAGQELLRSGTRMKWVSIKMGAKGSLLITTSSISCSPAFKVSICSPSCYRAAGANINETSFHDLMVGCS